MSSAKIFIAIALMSAMVSAATTYLFYGRTEARGVVVGVSAEPPPAVRATR
jgi:hypothetical protein